MDIEKTINALSQDIGIPLIVATDVERFVLSPITFWCNMHAPEGRQDSLPPYLQHLFTVGHEHQTEVIDESYTGAVQKVFYGEEEGLRLTLELMASGEDAIKNMPLISLPLGIEGRPDVLFRVDGTDSALGPFSYNVVEIKTARNIQKAHILQGAVYNRLLGAAQGYEPPEFYMINRDGDMQTIRMADVVDDLDQVLSDMRDVINGKIIEPCHGSAKWPWETYVNELAVQTNDVSLISGVGPVVRENLVSAGFTTVAAVANAQEQNLTKIRRVGVATAKKFISTAKAIHQNSPIRRSDNVQIPRGKTEVFFDFEGTDPRIGVEGLEVVNYLIGALVRSPSEPVRFVPFFAESFEDEERILQEFFEWGASLDDPVFYHWYHYERTHLNKMTEFFGITPTKSDLVMNHLVDLHPITTKAFAFPAYGEGLKEIARSLGFSWRHDDVDALTSVVLYFTYLNSEGADSEARQKILDYNEDDCLATMLIFDWLLSQ